MKVYLHIGTHKTGSTLIQEACVRLHEALREDGFFYPIKGFSGTGHHELAWAIKSKDEETARKLYKEIKDDSTREEVLLLSSEEFEFIRDFSLFEELFGEDEVSVIVYLRRQDKYLESEYNQHVRMYKTRFSGDIFQFFMFHNFDMRFNYEALLKSWESLAAVVNVIPESYDQVSDDNRLLSTFFEHIGVSEECYETEEFNRANVSIPPSALVYLVRWNRLPDVKKCIHDQYIELLKDPLLQEKIRGGLPVENQNNSYETFLGESYGKRLVSKFRDRNSFVSRKYFGRGSLFDNDFSSNFRIDPYEHFDLALARRIEEVVKH